jgi:predicted nuclease of predicted toxin-antitoxin system
VRFLFDESADARVGRYLRQQGYEVTGIANDHTAGLPDEAVLDIAMRERRILITHDLDFGRLVFVERQPHAGVILLRLGSSPALSLTISRLEEVFTNYAADLDRFIVVTRGYIRVR